MTLEDRVKVVAQVVPQGKAGVWILAQREPAKVYVGCGGRGEEEFNVAFDQLGDLQGAEGAIDDFAAVDRGARGPFGEESIVFFLPAVLSGDAVDGDAEIGWNRC